MIYAHVTFDEHGIYIALEAQPSVHRTVSATDQVLLDYDRAGMLVGVEVLLPHPPPSDHPTLPLIQPTT